MQPASQHLQRSREAYECALHEPSRCGSLQERWDVRHNYACALALGSAASRATGSAARLSHACGSLKLS